MASSRIWFDAIEVAALLLEIAPHDEHAPAQDGVAARLGQGGGGEEVGLGVGELAEGHSRLGARQHEPQPLLGFDLGGGAQVERLIGEAHRDPVQFGSGGVVDRLVEGVDGAVGEVVGHAFDRADLAGERGGGGVVVGHAVDVGRVHRRVRLDPVGDAVVALDPRRLRQGAVGDLAHEVGPERVDPVVVDTEEVLGDEVLERRDHVARLQVLGLLRHHLDGEAAEAPAEDGGAVEHLPLEVRQAVEPGRHEPPQRVGHAGAAAALAEERDELLEEERVAAAAVEHELAQVVGDVAGEVVEQHGGGFAVERVEVEDELVVATDRRSTSVRAGRTERSPAGRTDRSGRALRRARRRARARRRRPSGGRTARRRPAAAWPTPRR